VARRTRPGWSNAISAILSKAVKTMGKRKKYEALEDTAQADASISVQKLKKKDYDRQLARLHVELVKLQEWVRHEKKKICVVFEGREGAGKGGVIKAITDRVSPRTFRVIALPAPTEREKSQMYMQRYLPHLPAASEVVIFDRSWYNRAGVERVMGFCTEKDVRGGSVCLNRFSGLISGVPAVVTKMMDPRSGTA
jgi:polyphosphate kinase 2 (PPK2 family)